MLDHGLDADLVRQARALVGDRLRRTPTVESEALSERLGVSVWLKLEQLQVTGSFKVRGALFRLSRLTAAERARGVVTASAGNHGKGVAWAARALGVDATVFVPATVDAAKLRGIRALGARVVVSAHRGYDDTELEARAAAVAAGRLFVSAFDDPAIMAGNGATLAAEVLEDVPAARSFVVPAGGGGLAGGFAWFVAEEGLGGVVACQHEQSPALAMSLQRGEPVLRMPAIETVAGGIEGGIGRFTFAAMRGRVARVALVSEDEVGRAYRWLLAEEQLLVEPTAAVPVAACLTGAVGALDGPVVVVLSGRNVALDTVRALLGRSPGAAGP